MPPDDTSTVAPGTAVPLPRDGPSNGVILRTGPDTFNLPNIGTYQVMWQASMDEAGQLDIALNSGAGFVELPYTVVGRATGTNQIVGMSFITTTVINTVLSIFNPAGNPTALTMTPYAGTAYGTTPVTAHLIIIQVA